MPPCHLATSPPRPLAPSPPDALAPSRPFPRARQMATVGAGDAVVYDASVLHYGAANRVEGNERVVFYFGVSRAGHAERCAGPVPEQWVAAEPVRLWDYC